MWIAVYVTLPKRLGIDVQTLQYLGLSAKKLEENALDKKGDPSTHWVGLDNTLRRDEEA